MQLEILLGPSEKQFCGFQTFLAEGLDLIGIVSIDL